MAFRLLAILLLLGAPAALQAAPPLFYVAANGNDAWSGTSPEPNGTDGPFATLHQAQKALRAAGLTEGGTVYVREGVYFLTEPLKLEAADSGALNKEVLWQSYHAEKVRLVGGKKLGGFTPHKDQIVKCDLNQQGLAGKTFNQLFFNSERQILARWPNKSADGMPGGAWTFVAGAVENEKKRSFLYAGDRPNAWTSKEGVQVSIWPNYNWWQTIETIAVLDTTAKKIQLAKDLPYSIEPGRRFFFQNVLEELDAPGEWFLDATTGTVYFWPPAPMENAEAVAPVLDSAIILDHAQDITCLGFIVESTLGNGIQINESKNCLIARCTVRNTGGYGITINGGECNRAMGNDIYATGSGGISMNGGDRKTLTPGKHQAINNHIHHFAELQQTYTTGINISGVGNRIANNLIHDAPHIGILLGGNDHIIEFNEIHHVCMQGSDNGAFYMGRDWTQRGNIIRFNKFHDIYGFGLAGPAADGKFTYQSPDNAWGVYLDDCSSGVKIFGNLFYRVPLCGVMIGGGRDNSVENNTFVECIPALHIDARWDNFCWDVMEERLNAMNYKEPPYSTRYPELLNMGGDPRRPANNSFTKNILFYTPDNFRGLASTKPGQEAVIYDLDSFDPESTIINGNVIFHYYRPIRVSWSAYKQEGKSMLSWGEWLDKGFDTYSRLDDPLLFYPDKDDYQIRIDSPALKMNIKKLPFVRMGLYEDEFRASWPVPNDTRKDGMEYRTWTVDPAAGTVTAAAPIPIELPPPPPKPEGLPSPGPILPPFGPQSEPAPVPVAPPAQ
ncbi:MAG TPA: right-handed parallel beta-helix repeat-containing protein [Candidatus Hydrogenedentes bacterium]|nr:right-handed parallel beta-helix repeat-containing protein [Candidatus Hydrogenedentota bacterium]